MRIAQCRCGALTARCVGEPVRISVCHCLPCKRRSGSAFSAQARFAEGDVTIEGAARAYRQAGDSGRVATFHFCPECGATIAYRNEGMEGLVAIPIGAFADPDFPAPNFSVYENRKHRWVEIVGDNIEHD
ncbi:GFA family protein [Sphingomonas crusticola]|uniref:GFA family protein n=1 Tax=Sphingomonas crusticola TaxID=1697973 RepID=UPI000E25CD5D|nr:GFA family protein [Sphingomonas crusticola]